MPILPLEPADAPVLLLDALTVAASRHCQLQPQRVVRDPANPVIRKSESWEGNGPYTWGTRLLWRADLGRYDLYYVAWDPADNHYRWGVACSTDGLTWTRPELSIEQYAGATMRNQLTGGPHPDKAVRSVVVDPRPECPAAERFKAIRFTYDGEYIAWSADGYRWHDDPANPVWQAPSDIIHAMWDARIARFVAYFKLWRVVGETPDGAGGWMPVTRYFRAFTLHDGPDGTVELRGGEVCLDPGAAATVRTTALRLRAAGQAADDGGGGSLRGAWHSHRVIARAESPDWRHWRHEEIVLACDGRDRADANIQYLFVHRHGLYDIGILTIHDERGHFEQQLAFSHDGRHWSRPWRGNLLGLGAPGSFDSGMVLAFTDPIEHQSQLLWYYGGFDCRHDAPANAPWSAAIGRASMRRDGFAAWQPCGPEPAELLSQPLRGDWRRLWVNAAADGGSLVVEVLDPAGQCIATSRPLTHDSAADPACRAAVAWQHCSSHDPAWVQLRVRFTAAQLYAFGFGHQPPG